MFYRIIDNRLYDYADYEYAEGCLYSDLCTMEMFQKNPEIYTIIDGTLSYVPNYQNVIANLRKEKFEKEFFETSLGWIRRQVTMKNGSKKDFLADLLLSVKAGMEMGQSVEIITYDTPDYTKEPTADYIESLQKMKYATPEFIRECLFQTVKDFRGLNTDVDIETKIENYENNSDIVSEENYTDDEIDTQMQNTNENVVTGGNDGI